MCVDEDLRLRGQLLIYYHLLIYHLLRTAEEKIVYSLINKAIIHSYLHYC